MVDRRLVGAFPDLNVYHFWQEVDLSLTQGSIPWLNSYDLCIVLTMQIKVARNDLDPILGPGLT